MRLIDADELIKSIDYSADLGGALGKVVEVVKNYAKYMVQTAPTIKEHKTGKWIFVHPIQEDDSGGFLCSCCKYGEYKQSNYCPHCGVRMVGEEE